MKKKIVLIQGAFEILNSGHVRAFRHARSQGEFLIVAINSNALLKKYKGRDAVLPYAQKKIIIESIRWVDKVICANQFSPLALLKKHDVDVYMIAPEWVKTKAEEIAYMKTKGGKVALCHDYKRVIRTSDIKRGLLAEAQAQLQA